MACSCWSWNEACGVVRLVALQVLVAMPASPWMVTECQLRSESDEDINCSVLHYPMLRGLFEGFRGHVPIDDTVHCVVVTEFAAEAEITMKFSKFLRQVLSALLILRTASQAWLKDHQDSGVQRFSFDLGRGVQTMVNRSVRLFLRQISSLCNVVREQVPVADAVPGAVDPEMGRVDGMMAETGDHGMACAGRSWSGSCRLRIGLAGQKPQASGASDALLKEPGHESPRARP